MRTALISDIHGNLPGLMAVLADIAQQRCDRILCLGDLVDGGPQSVEVVQLLRDLAIPTVQGNHDEYPNEPLPLEIESYLRQLPEAFVEDQVVYTHTSPRRKKAKISDALEAWNVFEEVPFRRIFVGDVHIPELFGQHCLQKVSATSYPIPYDQEFPFAPEDHYIVCVDSVGYSRDAYNWLRYAIFDSEQDTILFHAPEGPTLVFSILSFVRFPPPAYISLQLLRKKTPVMKIFSLVPIAFAVFLWAASVHAADTPAFTTPAVEAPAVEAPAAIVQRAHEAGQFEGVVTVTQQGRLLYAQGFGFADRQKHFLNTLDTPYRICSVTKQFTALLVMQLVQSGKLRLDGTVQEYLPGALPPADAAITVKNLLTHTSGLPSLDDVPNFYGNPDPRCTAPTFVIQTYLQGPLLTPPGAKFSYNNADYIVVQAILEKLTQKSYAALLRERIFRPLGMRHSGVITRAQFAPKQAVGLVHDGGKVVPEPPYHIANFGAAGAMYSTARDLLRWNQALDRDTLLAKPYREIMFTADKSLGYVALGSWVYRGAFPGSPFHPLLVERQGEIGGFRTLNLRAPEDGVSIVVLSNTDTADLSATYLQKGLAYDLLRSLYAPKK